MEPHGNFGTNLKKANNEPFFIQLIFKKTELRVLIDHQIISFLKKCLGVGLVLTIFRARHVLEPKMSQGHSLLTCLRARLVSRFKAGDIQGPKCLMARLGS